VFGVPFLKYRTAEHRTPNFEIKGALNRVLERILAKRKARVADSCLEKTEDNTLLVTSSVASVRATHIENFEIRCSVFDILLFPF